MSTPPDYVFTRDYLDKNRINLQHYLWIELFGYHIHPNIPTQDAHLKIADIGTGTAVWLTDLAARLPGTVQLDGFDISFSAAPPSAWLPSNVTLRHLDIRAKDIPEDLVEKYDIVHIRAFAFVLQDPEILQVLQNLAKLLRPGGYLQWGEPDILSFRIEKIHPDNKVDALTQLITLSQSQDARLKPTWIADLPNRFLHSGLDRITADVKEAPPHMALATHECNLLIHEQLVRTTRNEAVAEGLKKLMPEVLKETRDGACWAFTRWTVVGRKVLNEG